MKKCLLFFLLSTFVISVGNAQQRAKVLNEKSRVSVLVKHVPPSDEVLPAKDVIQGTISGTNNMKPPEDAATLGDETEIIETLYDLQSNSALSNRIYAWPDGTISAVCTRGIDQPSGFTFPDRGTGYNYFNGSSWAPKPTSRIESIRTGWPSIAPLGINGECVLSHRSATAHSVFCSRTNKGTGAWTEANFPAPPAPATAGLMWPRMAASGTNNAYTHVFGLTAPYGNGGIPYMGQDGALLYFRSSNGGTTWDIQGALLEGLGSDYYLNISTDTYIMASKGNVVAVLVVDLWKDFFIMKSSDNGTTWQKIMIWQHPYPFFDLQTTLMSDTLYAPDKSASIAIDNSGKCHVVWGIGRAARLAAAPPDPGYYSYWPYTDGIGYWNENMGLIPVAPNPHHTMSPDYLDALGMLCGWTQDVNNSGVLFDYEGTGDPQFNTYRSIGISTMPSITINEQGVMVIAYSSVTETYVTPDGLQNYKHIWVRASLNHGVTWGDFYDLQANNIYHLYDECIYPVLAPSSPVGSFHLIYQADYAPGLYIDEDQNPTTNLIIHNKLNYSDLNIAVILLPPSNLTASVNPPNTVVLNWSSPSVNTENGKSLLGYNIYRDGNKINGFTVPYTTYTNLNVPVGLHTYYVKAVYSDGTSGPSNNAMVLIQSNIPEHFNTVWSSPYNPMTFYILEATIDEINLESDAEIGIFDNDPNTGEEICVGAGVIVEPLTGGNYLEIIASMDDGSIVGQANGFTPGHEIIYKLWSEVTGETSTVQANYPYPGYDEVFASQGSAFTELNGFTTITQEISLQTGWNLMSFRVEPENWNMLTIVQPLIDQGVLYKVLNETGGSIFHLPFPPPNGQWSNTIGNMENTEGYYVKVTGEGSLSLEGYPVETPMDIPLTTGWNIISYPCEFPENALTAVQPLINAGVLYKVIDEAGGTIFHLPFPPPNGQWSNTIGNFESGEGYYVKVTGNANLNISCPADGSDALPEIPAKQQTQFFQPVWENNPYMPMHVVFLPNEAFTAGDEIGVFDGEICVGATVYDGNSENPIIIVASMDDPETEILDGATAGHSFSIALWKNISGIVFEDIEYAIVQGSPAFSGLETSIIETKTLTGIFSNPDLTNPGSFSIYPNPCDQQTSINFYMPFNGVVEIGFYHPTGKATGFSVTKHFDKGQQSVLTENLTISPGLYLVKIDIRSETGFLQHFGKLIKR